jgi:hypothetical protein
MSTRGDTADDVVIVLSERLSSVAVSDSPYADLQKLVS